MSMINISPNHINDPFYRYKMSKINTKYEGQGNGQRTILLNIQNIANEINRNVLSILIYMTCLFGCKYIYNKENQYVLYGTYQSNIIQKNIYNFIELFVLCYNCKNPETELKNGNLICKACSAISEIKVNKITEKILKLYLINQ